jgi:undecaprenyl-diphosphatase
MSTIFRGTEAASPPGPATQPASTTIVRRWTDLVWLVLGSALLVLSALPVGAHSISATETSAFRLVNDLPSVPFAIVWLPMQLGNFLIVPAAVLARMYVGAHLPLDMVGGAALGLATGAAVRLALGTRRGGTASRARTA